MVELHRSEIPRVATSHALAAHHADQSGFVASGSLELPGVALMVMIRVSILASARAERTLPSAQRGATDDALAVRISGHDWSLPRVVATGDVNIRGLL